MQSYEDKVDAAVHAAFMALGLSAATRMELAYRLNDFITQEFRLVVRGDDEDPDDDPPAPVRPVGAAGAADLEGASDD